MRNRAVYLTAALAVILLAAGLRLHALGAQSLWNDEGASAAMIQRAPAAIVTLSAADIHPPGYYLLLAAWSGLAGASEFGLRALSALESVLTVALVIALGRRLWNRPAGLLAGLILALHTLALYYAQEARMYAQLGLLATAGMWLLAIVLTPGRDGAKRPRWPFAALGLVNAAGLYTQYAYPLSMLAQGVIFLIVWLPRRKRDLLLRYVLSNGLTLLLFAPWAGQALRQVSGWPNAGTGTDPATVLSVVGLGITARAGVTWPLLFGALILLAGGLWAARTRPLRWLPGAWLIFTVGGFLLLGLAPDDLKQLVPAASAAALVLGIGAVALWQQGCFAYRALAVVGSLLVGLALTGGLPPLYTDPAYGEAITGDGRPVQADPQPGDAVILDGPGQGEVWAYYAGKNAPPVYRCRAGWAGMTPPPGPRSSLSCATTAGFMLCSGGKRSAIPTAWSRPPSTRARSRSPARGTGTCASWSTPRRANRPRRRTPSSTWAFGAHVTLAGYALDRAVYHPGDALTLSLFWTTDAPLAARYKVFVHLYADPARRPRPSTTPSRAAGCIRP